MFTTKKTLIAIKTIVKTRDPWDGIENEMTTSETLNSETFFSQVSCKYASFSLVLGLMHECYIILFPDVFYILIWSSTCFVACFHISTSQKLRGNGISILFLTPGTRVNNEKLKRPSTNKTNVYSFLVTFDVLRLYLVTKKSKFLCAIFRILIHSDPRILQISFL